MTTKFLTPADLSEDFIVAPDKKVHCANSNGGKSTRVYACAFRGSTTTGSGVDEGWRRRLTLSGNLGIIHLDFKRTTTNTGIVATLPPAAPTPIDALAVQTWDGGEVIIYGNSRDVRCSGLSANRRYVIDLVGFFQ